MLQFARFYGIWILVSVFVFSSCKSKNTEKPPVDYMSPAWADYMHQFPGGNPGATPETVNEAFRIARQHNAAGLAFHRDGKDAQAIAAYENALRQFASGETYYNYGNSLANLNKLENAAQAYEIALKLKYERPELAFYNAACAYSRLGDIDKAVKYIAYAINRGYNAFEFMKTDPDLENLRKTPGWEDRVKNSLNDAAQINRDRVAGFVSEDGPRGATLYHLCPTGIIWIYYECGQYRAMRGTWKYEEGDIQIQLDTDCSLKASDPRMMGAACGGGDIFAGCRPPESGFNKFAIEKSTVARMFGEDTSEGMRITHSDLQNTGICDPAWRPASAEDVRSLGNP